MVNDLKTNEKPPVQSLWQPIIKNFAVPMLWVSLGFILAKVTTKKGVI
jgi:hypothetical protein